MPTDKLFTGQRLDGTGLYYYGARYYDPGIGRFISADSIVQSYANPQSLNRYSYVFNNPLKYVDPSGSIVEFENEDYVLELLASGDYWSPGSLIDEMIRDWAADRLDWEALRQEDPKYTQYIIDSDITFNITDVDLPSKTISYLANMPDISFSEPVQIRFVSQGPTYEFMKTHGDAPAISLYPGPISIRTDKTRTTKEFTWLVAHESYHRWEQTISGEDLIQWYLVYWLESRLPWGERASEIRANSYANHHYRVK